MHCGYCGRLIHRCGCHTPGSDLAQFMTRGCRSALSWQLSRPYKRAVPPQVKRRERQCLRSHFQAWYEQVADEYGEECANCGVTKALVLDHVTPIAKGGRSQLDNLQLLCATCNRIKGKLVIDCRVFKHPE